MGFVISVLVVGMPCSGRNHDRRWAQGHVIVDVAYRLYPETDIEGMVGDVRRSIAWMKAHGEVLGVKADRIVVGGGSAGAHLALLTAYTEGHPELTPPVAWELEGR